MHTTPRWEHFSHEADIGVRGVGATKAQAFEEAALALTAVVTDPETVAATESVKIVCEAPDDELLLTDWLNALVYEMATRKLLFCRFRVQINDHHLDAEACGEKVDVARHEPAVEVKGATLTSVRVAQLPDGAWIAQCVIDV
jgi:SHS2 domain-containing protein